MPNATQQPSILAVTAQESDLAALSACLGGLAAPAVVRRAAPQEAGSALKSSAPDLVVVFLDRLDERGSARVREIVGVAGTVPVLVALSKVEKSTLVGLIQLGAADVLEVPLVPGDVVASVTTLLGRRRADAQARTGRVWSVFGAGGGCGVTTLAVNVAERLASAGASVVVADLNLEMGDVALFLDVKPAYTVRDLAQNVSRLDAAFLSASLSVHESGLRVLAGPRAIEEAEEVAPAALASVLRPLRANCTHLFLDTPSVLDETTVEALDVSDGILLVCTLSVPSVRNAGRVRSALERLGYPPHSVRLVVNRYARYSDISLAEASKLVGIPVFHTVPNDYPAAIGAINAGEPIAAVRPRSALAKSLQELAAKLEALRSQDRTQEPAPGPAPAAETRKKWSFPLPFGKEA